MSLIYGYIEGNTRVHIDEYNPETDLKVTCSEGHILIAKRGTQLVHHFAHQSSKYKDCISYKRENKGRWHIWWQKRLQDKYTEVIHYETDNKGIQKPIHIADVKVCYKNNIGEQITNILEFQWSPISKQDVINRVEYYNSVLKTDSNEINHINNSKMIWVFSIERFEYRCKWRVGNLILIIATLPAYIYFAPLHKCTVFIDTGKREIIQILMYNEKNKRVIFGRVWEISIFDSYYLKNCTKDDRDMRSAIDILHADVTFYSHLTIDIIDIIRCISNYISTVEKPYVMSNKIINQILLDGLNKWITTQQVFSAPINNTEKYYKLNTKMLTNILQAGNTSLYHAVMQEIAV